MKFGKRIGVGVLLVWMVSVGLMAQVPGTKVLAEDGHVHGMGLIYRNPSTISSWHKLDTARLAAHAPVLPSSVMNTTYLPPVADQGVQDSGTAWAVAYYTKTFTEARKRDWDPSSPSHQFSPAYLYNQGRYLPDNGMTFGDATEILSKLGCASLDQMPYDPNDDASWPSEAAYKEAMRYRIDQVIYVDTTQDGGLTAIKQWLAGGNVAFAGVTVFPNFAAISSYNDDYCMADVQGAAEAGTQAITIIGYDDTRVTDDGTGAFRCVNSWGTAWGDKGYFWLSYQAASDPDRSIFRGFAAYWYDVFFYNPTIVGKFQITHGRFRDLQIMISTSSQLKLWDLSSWQDESSRDQDVPAPSHPIWVDLSYLGGQTYTMTVTDVVNPSVQGTLDSFEIVQLPGNIETISPGPPLAILPCDPLVPVPNGGFESGLSDWNPFAEDGASAPVITTSRKHSGSSAALLTAGGNTNCQTGLGKHVTIPIAGATKLIVWCYLQQDDPGPKDFQSLSVQDPYGNHVQMQLSADTRMWAPLYLDVSPFAGKDVGIYFTVVHDGSASGSTSMTLDDVAFLPEYPAVASATPSSLPPPTVLVEATPTAPVTGENAYFAASASGGSGGYTFTWDFGDGSRSDGWITSHAYAQAGTYQAFATVTDSYGTRVTSNEIAITVHDPLAVTLSASLTHGGVPMSVAFAPHISGGDGHYTCVYDYGDGSTGTDPNHTYTEAGTYEARVTVTDTAWQSATSGAVTITAAAMAPLTAVISASTTSGAAPLSVNFTSDVTGGDGSYTYAWDFGDGTAANTPETTKVYPAVGSYDVTLTVTDGSSHTAMSNILHVTTDSPPFVISMAKFSNPFRVIVYGSNLQEGLKIYINGRLWGDTSDSRLVKWKDENKIVIKKGNVLKKSVPKSTDTVFRFVNPDGGETTITWRW